MSNSIKTSSYSKLMYRGNEYSKLMYRGNSLYSKPEDIPTGPVEAYVVLGQTQPMSVYTMQEDYSFIKTSSYQNTWEMVPMLNHKYIAKLQNGVSCVLMDAKDNSIVTNFGTLGMTGAIQVDDDTFITSSVAEGNNSHTGIILRSMTDGSVIKQLATDNFKDQYVNSRGIVTNDKGERILVYLNNNNKIVKLNIDTLERLEASYSRPFTLGMSYDDPILVSVGNDAKFVNLSDFSETGIRPYTCSTNGLVSIRYNGSTAYAFLNQYQKNLTIIDSANTILQQISVPNTFYDNHKLFKVNDNLLIGIILDSTASRFAVIVFDIKTATILNTTILTDVWYEYVVYIVC